MPAPLSEQLHTLLRAALAGADAGAAVRRSLALHADSLAVEGAPPAPLVPQAGVWVVGAGKATSTMAAAALAVLGERVRGGAIAVPHGTRAEIPGIDLCEAAHPLPDTHSLTAATAALRLARSVGPDDGLLCLLSGGGSALWGAPPTGVPLDDLRLLTQRMLRAGVPIEGMNSVRRHLSRIAGGGLARAARGAAWVRTLVISDVVGSAPEAIASGPTSPDPTTYADALAVLDRYDVEVPAAARGYLRAGAAGRQPETPKPGDPAFEHAALRVVASVADALRAAAEAAAALGYEARVKTDRMTGEARDVAAGIVAELLRARETATRPVALFWGGETTVTVRGQGRGGRNQELALAAALRLEGVEGVALLALGTDGIDGPTDAAGAMVDGQTVRRGRAAGLDAAGHLARNDSYPFLRAAGALLVTGRTGTNVGDVVVGLVAPGAQEAALPPAGNAAP